VRHSAPSSPFSLFFFPPPITELGLLPFLFLLPREHGLKNSDTRSTLGSFPSPPATEFVMSFGLSVALVFPPPLQPTIYLEKDRVFPDPVPLFVEFRPVAITGQVGYFFSPSFFFRTIKRLKRMTIPAFFLFFFSNFYSMPI